MEDFIENFDELEMCHLSLDAMIAELIRSPVRMYFCDEHSSLPKASVTITAAAIKATVYAGKRLDSFAEAQLEAFSKASSQD